MAYFAKLDENNIVTNVEGVENSVITDENGAEQESLGVAFLRQVHKNPEGVWKQTSYNTIGGVHKLGGTPFRKNYAGIGYKYDESVDAFYRPEYIDLDGNVYTKWVLNTTTYQWEPPIPYPVTYDDGLVGINEDTGNEINIRDHYNWNDDTGVWEKPSV